MNGINWAYRNACFAVCAGIGIDNKIGLRYHYGIGWAFINTKIAFGTAIIDCMSHLTLSPFHVL